MQELLTVFKNICKGMHSRTGILKQSGTLGMKNHPSQIGDKGGFAELLLLVLSFLPLYRLYGRTVFPNHRWLYWRPLQIQRQWRFAL